MPELRWTLIALVGLGGTAAADSGSLSAADMAAETAAIGGWYRGVARGDLFMPRGGELTAQMRFFTAGAMLGGDELRFTDLAMFGLAARWSLFSKLELGASVELLPKQPSTSDEKPWQSAGVSLRSPLGKHIALQVSGAGGHLVNHSGKWMRESLSLGWNKPVHDLVAFNLQAGVSGLGLDAPNTESNAFITEVALNTTALFREPRGRMGAWLGIAYAVPVQASGRDPTTDMPIDAQPRLDFHMGTVLSVVPKWDLFVDFAVIDRGDPADPATQLPILDGGFDQTQIMFGVTRRLERKKARRDDDDDDGGGAMRLGML